MLRSARAFSLVIILTLIALTGSLAASSDLKPYPLPDHVVPSHVVRVVDGDTLVVKLNGEEDRVRLIGVDTPETVHPTVGEEPYGKEASSFTKSLLPAGTTILLEWDAEQRDRYGRLLAYVYRNDGVWVNAELIRQGYAQILTVPPNVKHVEDFRELQTEARAACRGLWALEALECGIDKEIAANAGGVVIVWVDKDAEVVMVRNSSDKLRELTGWTLVSERGDQRFDFPDSFTLGPGDEVQIVSGRNAHDPPRSLKWTGAYVWNNSEADSGHLVNSMGEIVSTWLDPKEQD